MSMHFGGEQGYGLFLNTEEAEAFVHKYATTNFLSEDEDEYDVYCEIGASDLCDDRYDIRQIWHLDGKAHKEDGDTFVDGIFLYAEKQGCIVLDHSDDAYANLFEMADEFRQAYGNYLPDDFDYVAHL
ncbi:MAG: hypothetical protein MR218_08440, partial [Eubacterium sp.]|nr:hypothetical protein [Eubacterium sp.]